MKLPSMIKGWLNTSQSPEKLYSLYLSSGKSKHLDDIVAQFNQPLYHYLLTQSDAHLAKDVLQSTWLKVMNYRDDSFNHNSFRNWLFTIARNTLIDELRRINRWQWHELDETNEPTITHQNEFNQSPLIDAFNDTLTALPFHQKEAFVLQQEGFTLVEIAMITGEKQETIKSRLRYARNTLKARLEQVNE